MSSNFLSRTLGPSSQGMTYHFIGEREGGGRGEGGREGGREGQRVGEGGREGGRG